MSKIFRPDASGAIGIKAQVVDYKLKPNINAVLFPLPKCREGG
jgi:hypothetical protein